jgi:glycosyltransferase involved in cell wall biosynthesis
MTPKRVLFVNPVGEKGGAEVVLLDIARGLDRARFEPLVACLKPGPFVEELRALQVPAFALRAHKGRELHRVIAAVAELAGVIRRERIDLVHGNGCTMLFYGGLAARFAGRPCVWQVYDPLKGGGAFERAFVTAQRRLHPAWTIFGTPAVADSYLAAYKRLRRHSTILPGVDPERLLQGADPCRARAMLGIPPDAPVVSMFARLQRGKGHLELVEAAARVLEHHPGARFVLCGGTLFDLEPDYPRELRRRIKERGLGERVRLTGYVSEEEKSDILAASTVVVHPARSEPFGISVIEGMAAGKAVVATDCAGPRTTVRHGETGLLVPRGDVPALSAALRALLDDPRRAGAMGDAGRRRVREHFTVRAMVRQVEDVYRHVLGERPA